MKQLLLVLFIVILFLGCTGAQEQEETLTEEPEAAEEVAAYSFDEGIEELQQMDERYYLSDDYNTYIKELQDFNQTLTDESIDTDALKDLIKIKVDLEKSKKELELAEYDMNNNLTSCSTVEHLSNFMDLVNSASAKTSSFMETYPEFVHKTRLNDELVDKLNSNSESVSAIKLSLNRDMNCY